MKLKARGLTSLLLAGTFALVAISGVALYVKPKGRVANWTGWTLGGLNKSQWESLHTNACLLLLIAAGFHIYLNWRTFFGYLKRSTGGIHLRLEIALTVATLAVVMGGTLLEVPPFSTTADLGDRVKKYWEESAISKGPAPHAEEFSIERFSRSIGVPTLDLVAVLRREGLQFSDAQTTISQLARDNDLTPAQIYTAITKHHSKAIRDGAINGTEQPKGEQPKVTP